MSLLSSASLWTMEDSIPKRTSINRRTIKKIPTVDDNVRAYELKKDFQEKMTLINADNEGDSLTNFSPISHPVVESKSDRPQSMLPPEYHDQVNIPFSPDNPSKISNSDYRDIYDGSLPTFTPSKNNDIKVMDKLGYIVHLLEQQQNDKTNNLLEEYILYILLGVFIIFIVDSFAKGGKYSR